MQVEKTKKEGERTMIRKTVEDLFVLRGSMPPPVGELERTEDGYRFQKDGYELVSRFEEHRSGVTKRSDTIRNVSDHPIALRCILSKLLFNGGEYEVYTQYGEWCEEGRAVWEPLNTEIGARSEDVRMNCGVSPFLAIYNRQNQRGYAIHLMADSMWQIHARKQYRQVGHIKTVAVELGINERGFSYTLAPNETLELPSILYYEFRNKTDLDAYKLHRYCNDVYPAKAFPIIYNSWMGFFDRITVEKMESQFERAKRLGVEYFTVDAGWFGAPYQWYDRVGDWEESPESGLGGRMRELADRIRENGMQFGLWFEIERAAKNSQAVAKHPDYYIEEDGRCFVNFAKPEVCDALFETLAKAIRAYGIAFIKFDFNARLSYDERDHAFLEYFKGYRGFIRRIRETFPDLYLENCASGGLRMALTNLDGSDSFWMSDTHSIYKQQEIFKSTLLRMPCRALEKWLTIRGFEMTASRAVDGRALVTGDVMYHTIDVVSDSYLLAASVGGPIGFTCDLNEISDETMNALEEHLATYRRERDFWKSAECRILSDTEDLLALQFSDEALDTVYVYAFCKGYHQNAVTLYPVCDPETVYHDEQGNTYTGVELDADGVTLDVHCQVSATWIKLKK